MGVLYLYHPFVVLKLLGAPTDYSVAKAALNALSKNLAKKVGPDVRVNCVVATGNVYFEGGTWENKIKENKSLVDRMLENEVPLKRFGKPEEVADAVTFLCSERASFITGSTLVVETVDKLEVFETFKITPFE